MSLKSTCPAQPPAISHRLKLASNFIPIAITLTGMLLLSTTTAAQPDPPQPPKANKTLELPDAPTVAQASQTNQIPAPAVPVSPVLNPPEPNLPGILRGVVVDRDGAVYQGVRISLIQPAPIALPERTAVSDSNGRFQFAIVPAGIFTLTVSSEGFQTQVVSGVLHPGEIFEAPAIVLPFATASSEIRVTASRQEIAQEQVTQEEHQRVLGVIPNFYVSYVPNAPPLTKRQKFDLAWKSSIDPVSFLAAGFFAGVEQAEGDFKGYGYGAQGYGKRYGANFADNIIGSMIGGAILPSVFKQDPRYFYKGTGPVHSRILYAIATSVICKGDNGHWQANYSAIIGGLAAGGISNLYYPASDRNGASLTFQNALLGTAGTAVGNLFQEFLVKRLTPRLPKYGPSQP